MAPRYMGGAFRADIGSIDFTRPRPLLLSTPQPGVARATGWCMWCATRADPGGCTPNTTRGISRRGRQRCHINSPYVREWASQIEFARKSPSRNAAAPAVSWIACRSHSSGLSVDIVGRGNSMPPTRVFHDVAKARSADPRNAFRRRLIACRRAARNSLYASTPSSAGSVGTHCGSNAARPDCRSRAGTYWLGGLALICRFVLPPTKARLAISSASRVV